MRGQLTIIVNTKDDEHETRMLIPEPIASLQGEVVRVAEEFPDWTSMVVVFTNPKPRP